MRPRSATAPWSFAARGGKWIRWCSSRARPSLHHVCFGTSAEGLEDLKGALDGAATKLIDAPDEWPTDGLWLRDPDGLLINIQAAEEVPWRQDAPPAINAPGQSGRIDRRAVATEEVEIRPRRFGHMLLFTPDLERKAAFFGETLGLRISDSVETFLKFLYAPAGSDHHIIGLGLSRGPGSNYFHYVRDPWNSIAEYFCDMDSISAWRPRVWRNEDADASWGPHLPADFLTNFKAMGGPRR